MAKTEFTQKVIEIIKSIPRGRVCAYGAVARMAGSPRGARQVARILHSCSKNENLPWHRVVNRQGEISLSEFQGGGEQRKKLEREGVVFDQTGRIDMAVFMWTGERGNPP